MAWSGMNGANWFGCGLNSDSKRMSDKQGNLNDFKNIIVGSFVQ